MTKTLPIFVVVAALALMACAQPQAAPSAPAGQAAGPKAGGTLNTLGEDLTDFDMGLQGKTIANATDHGLVYNSLLTFKKGSDMEFVSQILQPQLAQKWEIGQDAKSFTYTLLQGVKFGDVPPVNGRELTSADVKWSMEYYSRSGEFKDAKLPPSQMAPLFEGIDAVDPVDKYTVRVRFKEPFAPFLNYSASQWMPIAAKEVYQQDGNLSKTLIGTGPYMLDTKNSLKDNRWVFIPNPNYWGEKPYLESIRRLVIPDQSTQMAAFQVKQIDVLAATDYKMAAEIQRMNPETKVDEALNPWHRNLFVSQKRGGPLTDIRVRKAISLAMDRDEYNKVWSGGKGAWALSGAWPGLFTDAEAHQMMRYDPEASKKLLAEAGFPNGLTLEMMPLGAVGIPEQLIQAQLKRVGIEVTMTILPREQNRARLYVGDYDLVSQGDGGIGDADFDALQYSYHSSSPQNWAVIKDPELDKLVLAQRREGDPAKRRDIQRSVVQRINEMAWNPGYFFAAKIEFWQPYVKNYRPHFSVGQKDAFVWLDK